MQLKQYLFLFMIVCLASVLGCATTYDLQRVQEKFDSDIQSLKEENAGIRKDIEKVNKDASALTAKDGGCNDIKKTLDQISNKIDFIEEFLDIAKNQNQSEGNSKNVLTGKMVEKSVYELAYETFKKGKYGKARIRFQSFLKQYPNTEYSDDAEFWIGECYYLEKKYKEAILEYEKVVKNYPEGNKVSSALLMQGLSYLRLNDKPSAKLILQRVIQDYPNTSQARIAKEQLIEIN
jgi:tol-pal system protein YbgF